MITMASPVDADLLRLRHEFISMPMLALTVAQVARLLSIRPAHAADILGALEAEEWLVRMPGGVYRRAEQLGRVRV